MANTLLAFGFLLLIAGGLATPADVRAGEVVTVFGGRAEVSLPEGYRPLPSGPSDGAGLPGELFYLPGEASAGGELVAPYSVHPEAKAHFGLVSYALGTGDLPSTIGGDAVPDELGAAFREGIWCPFAAERAGYGFGVTRRDGASGLSHCAAVAGAMIYMVCARFGSEMVCAQGLDYPRVAALDRAGLPAPIEQMSDTELLDLLAPAGNAAVLEMVIRSLRFH